MDYLAGGNLILNLVLSFGLKFLWNFVNLLQFLVFMQLWDIYLPSQAQAVIKFLKNIALLEFIPTKQITGTIAFWFGLDQENNVLSDMGLMLVIGLVIILALGVLVIVGHIAVNHSYDWYRRYRQVK